jgi:hypothetical protein
MKTRFGARHFITGLDPVADALSGTVTSDVIKVSGYHLAEFIIHKGVGATGTSTITVEACSNAAGDNAEAVPFEYQAYDSTSDDVPDDVVAATAAGFTTLAGSSQIFVIGVSTDRLPENKPWLRLKAVEVVDSPVLAGILVELSSPRYAAQVPATAIA